MKILKKVIFIVFTGLLLGVFCSCSGILDKFRDQDAEENYYLTLTSYNVTLSVGDTVSLTPEKFDEKGAKKQIEKTIYESEAEHIANVDGGLITAISAGETYINVTADGLQASCFVTVLPVGEGFNYYIWLSDDTLYYGTEGRAKVVAYNDGKEIENFSPEIKWSVDDEEKVSVKTDGTLEPLTNEGSVTVYAEFTYCGDNYCLEKTIYLAKLEEVSISVNRIKLATPITLSGAENKQSTEAEFTVTLHDVLGDEEKTLTTDEFTVQSKDETIVKVVKSEETKIKVQAVSYGNTDIVVVANGKVRSVSVAVVTAVSSVKDMDILAMASYDKSVLLAKDYMLTGDIDYAGKIIYPIAAYRYKTTHYAGIQWKYLLDKNEDQSYSLLDRDTVGAENSGLTDEEFIVFAQNGGINASGFSFTGTFDGNGYSIKDGQLMYGGYGYYDGNGYWRASYMSVFGHFKGELKNISFDGVIQQDPATSEYDLNRAYTPDDGTIIDDVLYVKKGLYCNMATGLLGRCENATLQNVFLHIKYLLQTDHEDGSLMAYGTNVSANDCVVSVELGAVTTRCAFNGMGAKESSNVNLKNNFAFGVNRSVRYMKGHPETAHAALKGANGNWWTSGTDAASIFSERRGAAVYDEEYISLKDTIASFDASVWNMTAFNATDNSLPVLIKDCSIYNL